jgi:site-specific DNA-cytosine methylase
MYKLLDVFCGLGGVSDGFALEGFDVLGIAHVPGNVLRFLWLAHAHSLALAEKH